MRTPTTRTDLAPLVKRVTAFLDDFEASLGPTPPHLTTIDKRRAAKPRKGATKVLLRLAPVVQQHGLDSSALRTEQMIGRLEDAETKKDRPTKVQSRAKAQLKSALSLAAKYDVAADATSPPAETSDEPIRGT